MDVGLQKGQANLLQGFLDVFFGQLSLATKVLEDFLDFLG
jgi:hypothetical protein